MKKILAFLFILLVCAANAQTNIYHPLPDTNAVWSVSNLKYIVKGDSIYNSKIYKKYYVTLDTNLGSSSLQYVGMVRQDINNKKVYGIDASLTTEGIIYNFNLNVNDTITVHPIDIMCMGYSTTLKITGKDSILINGSYRQRVSVANYSNSFFRDTLIEGIGSCEGPLAPGLNPYCAVDVCWPILLCQKQNGSVIYQNPLYSSCYISCSGIGIYESKDKKRQLKVYPNPAQNSLQVAVAGNSKIQAISLFDIFGNEVLVQPTYFDKLSTSSNPSGEGNSFDVSSLQNGVYFLNVKTKENNYIQKFIKE